jgi:DsbC/DsbD-like thiol-disulfide interchange protein
VKPRAYVSLEPVPRGRTFEVAVVAEIQQGFHINANKVLEDYLIPTSVQADWPKGLRLVETVYPPGEMQKFDFSEKLLNVYDGSVTLRMKVQVAADAPLGAMTVPITLRYQACNDRACLPPVRLSVPAQFQIAEAGAAAKAQNPEIFQKASPAKRK